MEESSDGFYSGRRLENTGAGRNIRNQTAWTLDMKLADMVRHMEVLNAARDEAKIILTDDPQLIKPANQPLKRRITKLFGKDYSLNL